MMNGQRGLALAMVLIFLAVGSLALVPTLRYASSAFKLFTVSRESAEVEYALDALTQQALWYLQYKDPFKDCDNVTGTPTPDGLDESFAECVAMWGGPVLGGWTLATPGKLTGVFNETQVNQVNKQDASVTVSVPGGLTAPTPTPLPFIDTECLTPSVTRDPTWVQVGEPITYTVTFLNCYDSPATFQMRRLVMLLPPEFTYVLGSTTGDYALDPEDNDPDPDLKNVCDGPATLPDPDYFGCLQPDNSVLLDWPTPIDSFGQGEFVELKFNTSGETKAIAFQATSSGWGVFYVEANVCFLSATSGDPGPCVGDNVRNTGKVAPVVVGMFNLQGKGKGHAFKASSKLDNSGSDLISQQPQ